MTRKKNTPENFENAVEELEKIVQSMEQGQLPLEQAMTHYQRGIELLNFCQKILQQAEQKVMMLEKAQLIDISHSSTSQEVETDS